MIVGTQSRPVPPKLPQAVPALQPEAARRRRFSTSPSEADLVRAQRRIEIAGIRINTDVVRRARERFDVMLKGLQVDDLVSGKDAEELEARCLVVTAASGAGKSHLLRRLRENPMLVPFVDEAGPVRPLLAVKAPSPCTLKTLGLRLYEALTGKRLRSSLKEHEIWMEVRAQIDAQLVSVVMIDEFHHAFARRSADERRSLVETLKNLAIPDPDDPLRPPGAEMRPVMLVLSGMPWALKVLDQDLQLRRRCVVHPIEPLGNNDADRAKARKFLELVESKLGFPEPSGLASDDMIQRMMRASNGYTGRMMAFIKEAAFIAVVADAPRLDRAAHLATAFEEIFRVGPRKNPFLVADVSACPKIPEAAFEKLTLLQGTGPASDEETPDD